MSMGGEGVPSDGAEARSRSWPRPRSVWRTLLFWWLLLVVIQQAQRLFLLIRVVPREAPSARLFTITVVTGVRADLVTAGLGIAAALLLAVAVASLVTICRRRWRLVEASSTCARALAPAAATVAALYMLVLTADMGYYQYNGQRLDPVFLEYVTDLLAQTNDGAVVGSQVERQTTAEIRDIGKWIAPVAGYLVVEAAAVAAWWLVFARLVGPTLATWEAARPRLVAFVLLLAIAAGAWGVHPAGPDSVQAAAIGNSTYYTLAQNPIWYIGNEVDHRINMPGAVSSRILAAMPEAQAHRIVQGMLLQGAIFPSSRYPLVHLEDARRSSGLPRRPNVLLIFVEALDRRFIGQMYGGVRGTPFLDRLLEDAVYFDHFFSNGANTLHGLFSSLCSSLPREGIAAIKARYANDYLCLPALLRRAGYQTRMVIGQSRDRSHSRLGFFLARNGVDELIDESGFPPQAERMGLGMTDRALFARVRAEIEVLRGARQPYFLTTLTTGTHHPFAVPDAHPDVAALRAQADRYVAALRYFDLEFERFLTGLQRDGLLRDTVVLVLGDHGRHERIEPTSGDADAGHFMAPLAIWLDPSLRVPSSYRPRVVSSLVSQVDLTPTILGLAGLTPRLTPFVGRDVSCSLIADCLSDRPVYLSSTKDDSAGIADRDGFWFYSLRAHTLEHSDLAQRRPPQSWPASDPAAADRVERILALYVTANTLIERNALWSWKEFGSRL